MDFNFKKTNNKGFTLIEIVISIFILSFALIGIFSAFSIIVISTSDTVNQLTATYLAQEGMELVRNTRDTNWLNMDTEYSSGSTPTYSWLGNGLSDCSNCKADYTLFPAYGDYLNIDKDGFYSYNAGKPTIFQRKIIVQPVDDVNEKSDHIIKVIVQVSWDKKATILSKSYKAGDIDSNGNCYPENCVTTEETLYNWYYPNH